MMVTGKILEDITLWRRGETREVKIGREEQDKIGWENFLLQRIAIEMRNILPRAGADNHPKKPKRLVRTMAQAVFAGAETMWRTRCDLAAGSGAIRISVCKK